MPDQSDQHPAFDHLIHWVEDLDESIASYNDHGLPSHEALTMPGFRNGAWGIDDERYVEQAAVGDWDAVTGSTYAGSLAILKPHIDARNGPGPVSFAVNVTDARATAKRLHAAGHEVDEIEVRFEDQDAGFVEVFLRGERDYVPFFITYDPPREEIAAMRAEHRAKEGITFDGVPDLVAILVRADDPEGEARRVGDVIGCPVDGTTVELPGAEIRFGEVGPDDRVGLHGIVVGGPDGVGDGGPFEIAGLTVQRDK
ncbi:MAG: VOC family protein [Mycobacteriaceae bacterium]|uniref:VOC family protein n=1 Tax=Corynebacterium sp. TaxID=1720 RepID=UPI003F96C0A2